MESLRVNFTGGIATIPDPTLFGGGSLVRVADNVDLRSGLPRPVLAPSYLSTALSTTVQIFSYRGTTIESSALRSYVAHMYGSSERIYWTEYGTIPKKCVNGTTVKLGIDVPRAAPTVQGWSSYFVPDLTAVKLGSGSLVAGRVSYRVSVKKNGIILSPCAAVVVAVTDGSSSKITWGRVDDAEGYVVFGRTEGGERKLAEVGSEVFEWVDSGALSEGGNLATSYENSGYYRYIFTFIRNVNGMIDESGPSPMTPEIVGSTSRKITFNPELDGSLDDPDAKIATVSTDDHSIAINNTYIGHSPIYLGKATENHVTRMVVFDTVDLDNLPAPHGRETGDYVEFWLGDLNWSMLMLKIVKISDTSFAVERSEKPTDKFPLTPTEGIAYTAFPNPMVYQVETKISMDGLSLFPADWPGTTDVAITIVADGLMFKYPSGTSTGNTFKATLVHMSGEMPYWQLTVPAIYYGTTKTTGISITIVKSGTGVTGRRLYRIGDTAEWLLVAELDYWQTEYVDILPYSMLEGTPTSYYNENGVDVVFAPPPDNLSGLEEHLGMMFGIDGNRVRWTPIGKPDAWPEVYSTPALTYKPQVLKSSRLGLMVICEDTIYRLDGNHPASMLLNKTNVEDGCVEPLTVQTTTDGSIIYVAARGIMMMISGMDAICITSAKLHGDFFRQPAVHEDGVGFKHCWLPTLATHSYAAAASDDGIPDNQYAFPLSISNPMQAVSKNLAAFVYDGKYYLYWRHLPMDASFSPYSGNACLCVDLTEKTFPVTTLGLRPTWVHVDSLEVPRALLWTATESGQEWVRVNKFQGDFTANYISGTGHILDTVAETSSIWRLFSPDSHQKIGMFIRTGPMDMGMPSIRKRFSRVVFYGKGSLSCRVMCDGHLVAQDLNVDITEGSNYSRAVNIPNGTKGYCIDIEFCGLNEPKAVEVEYEPMGSYATKLSARRS